MGDDAFVVVLLSLILFLPDAHGDKMSKAKQSKMLEFHRWPQKKDAESVN